jgi:hypothetical protein
METRRDGVLHHEYAAALLVAGVRAQATLNSATPHLYLPAQIGRDDRTYIVWKAREHLLHCLLVVIV